MNETLLIETYLQQAYPNGSNASIARIRLALKRICQILEQMLGKYGIDSLYNGKNRIDTDGIYAVGKVMQLDQLINQAPTPITINKHSKFIEQYLEVNNHGFNRRYLRTKDSN